MDCIAGFEKVANSNPDNSGKLIRLENINGAIRQVEYTPHEMGIANDCNIEMR